MSSNESCLRFRQEYKLLGERLDQMRAQRDGSYYGDLQVYAAADRDFASLPEHGSGPINDSDCLLVKALFDHRADVWADKVRDARRTRPRQLEAMVMLAKSDLKGNLRDLVASMLSQPLPGHAELEEARKMLDVPALLIRVNEGFRSVTTDMVWNPFCWRGSFYAFPLLLPNSVRTSSMLEPFTLGGYYIQDQTVLPCFDESLIETVVTLASDGATLKEALEMGSALEVQ